MHQPRSAFFCVSLLSVLGSTTATTNNVRLQTIDGTLVLHMPKGKALKVQFHDENGTISGEPQTVAFKQELEDLKMELQNEFKASLLAETEARTSADTAFTAADTALTASLLAETEIRTSADAAFTAADTALTASLLAETEARTSVDTAFTAADTALTASLLAETKARTAADTAFTASILAESKIRTTADTAFTKELNPLKPFATIDTNNFLRKLTTLPNPGMSATKTYYWPDLFNKLFLDGKEKGTTVFQSGATYVLVATSSNGVHSHTYRMNLRIGGTTYGGVYYRYKISNVKQVNGPWHGGCGSNPFSSINDNYLSILGNACNEAIDLWISRIA